MNKFSSLKRKLRKIERACDEKLLNLEDSYVVVVGSEPTKFFATSKHIVFIQVDAQERIDIEKD